MKIKFSFVALVLFVFGVSISLALDDYFTVLIYEQVETGSGVFGPPTESRVAAGKYDFQFVNTVGNRSYIPLSICGTPHGHRRLILDILDKFERSSPGYRITSWSIEKDQPTRGSDSFIFGIWVNHQPRKR